MVNEDRPRDLSIAQRVAATLAVAPITAPSLADALPSEYESLRRLAHRLLSQERVGHTLPPTGLVHEAYLQIRGSEVQIQDQQHYFHLLARSMRRVLADRAKARLREKREVSSALQWEPLLAERQAESALAIDSDEITRALEEVSKSSEQMSNIIQLFYFFQFNEMEIAVTLGLSESTVDRSLRLGKSLLKKALMEITHRGTREK